MLFTGKATAMTFLLSCVELVVVALLFRVVGSKRWLPMVVGVFPVALVCSCGGCLSPLFSGACLL